ncbi:hypothetical protein SISNIDRAFT_485730 [Sistotremastrum niveocremeum HHB9708]|uniref:Anaphase-promoting complex subunit 5 n=1 Tax=Sistotremastrum niveocremeum HHB9708 TaxID=1314777 RepID=A0A164URZ2_9AGAM|nr:hypothetical protein SISNIDRAFT_485730 [Sistotremastrum niveocremeum HHB9708]
MPSAVSSDPVNSEPKQTLKRKRNDYEPEGSIRVPPPLSPQLLLLQLPTLLAHPPSHPLHIPGLHLSLLAYRKCLSLGGLTPDSECRALLGIVEVGIRVAGAGLSTRPEAEWTWAARIENEVERSIGKGLLLCEQHTSLRIHKVHFLSLHVRLAIWQHNFKNDPPHTLYMPHLSLISLALSSNPPDIPQALQSTATLSELAVKLKDQPILLLSNVIRLRILMKGEQWTDVPESLQQVETLLRFEVDPALPNSTNAQGVAFRTFETSFDAAMAVHTLMLGIVYYTQIGNSIEASKRLAHLHFLLDSGLLEAFPQGLVSVVLQSGPPLLLRVTHPRILLQLAFLTSSISKRDPVGRKPRRKAFAQEGLSMIESESRGFIDLPLWSGLHEMNEVTMGISKIKADLLCELAAVAISRSEFSDAKTLLSDLISYTRSTGLFPSFAARIALHQAHLAHATGNSPRAMLCYRAAAHLGGEGTWLWASARAGEIGLRIGLGDQSELSPLDRETLQLCRGSGGTLECVGRVLEAASTDEIVKAKQHLKLSLEMATAAQDNHLRALVLAITSSYYFHTAGDHALVMLRTCRQLAAGMGSSDASGSSQSEGATGNAALGLWVGERFLEIYNRQGRLDKVEKQKVLNEEFTSALGRIVEFASQAEPGRS